MTVERITNLLTGKNSPKDSLLQSTFDRDQVGSKPGRMLINRRVRARMFFLFGLHLGHGISPIPAQSMQVYAFPNRGGNGLISTQPFPEQHGHWMVRLLRQVGHCAFSAICIPFTCKTIQPHC